jgi:hypothetical protein
VRNFSGVIYWTPYKKGRENSEKRPRRKGKEGKGKKMEEKGREG